MAEPLILIHGGAGNIPESRVKGKLDGVRRALEIGHAKYAETKNILDATQAAVEYMEVDENFNAGLHFTYCSVLPSIIILPILYTFIIASRLDMKLFCRIWISFDEGRRHRTRSIGCGRKKLGCW